MAFNVNNNLVFINSMQFKNSSLYALVKDLSKIGFKYLSQEPSGDLLKLLKQRGVYPYEYLDSFEKFFNKNLPNNCKFFSSLEDEFINEKYYLHAIHVSMCLK